MLNILNIETEQAQEYLDKHYPLANRKKVTYLNIWNENLQGNLDLSDFVNLERLDCSYNKLTSINLSSCQRLEWFNCSFNQLTKLELTNIKQLKIIDCRDNFLTSFDYKSLNPDKLTWLDLGNNNLSEQNLSVFSKLVNLEVLKINNDNHDLIQRDLYNRFHGSLKFLKNLTKLKLLDASNTNLNSGYEYLTPSVKKVYCSSQERPMSRIKEMEEKLRLITKELTGRQLKEWINLGLQSSEYAFITYLTKQGFYPTIDLNLSQLKSEYYTKSQQSQDWLDNNYPKQIKKTYKKVYLTEPTLEGELDLEDFTHEWLKVYIYPSIEENKLILKNLPIRSSVIKLANALSWLNKNYPQNDVCQREMNDEKWDDISNKDTCGWNNFGKTRSKITKLDISRQKLEGNLDLSDFINLKELECGLNKLTSLNLSKCTQLETVYCADNLLTSISLPTNPANLKVLDLRDNNFSEQDLSFLEKAVNLEWLNLPNNNFSDSLQFLQNMTNLKYLSISNTKLDGGLKHLTLNLEKLVYSDSNKTIYQEAKRLGNILPWEDHFPLNKWREVNSLENKKLETQIIQNVSKNA